MRTKRNKEGYLQIDHRASPGTKLVPAGANFETATATCCHCNEPFQLNRMSVHWCSRCDDYVCTDPQCRECKPFSQKLDELEKTIRNKLAWENLWHG